MKNSSLSNDQINSRMHDMLQLIVQLQQRVSTLEDKIIQITKQTPEQKKEEGDFFDSVTEGGAD